MENQATIDRNVDLILCRMAEGKPVTPEEFSLVVEQTRARILRGEQGADLPIAMQDLGCDYDKASDAVLSGNLEAALKMLDWAVFVTRRRMQRDAIPMDIVHLARRALIEYRLIVDIGEEQYRFARQGEKFSDGDFVYEAKMSGVFKRQESAENDPPVRWMIFGSSDDLEDIIGPALAALSPQKQAECKAAITGDMALNSFRKSAR